MRPIIQFEHVWKQYSMGGLLGRAASLISPGRFAKRLGEGRGWAVQDLSFELYPGDSLGLIGRNGSGKTTTLRLAAAISRATSGKVITRGRIASLIALGAGFHQELSGRENIFLNGTIMGLTRAELQRKFESIVEFAELGEYIDMPVKFYSSGMYARLGFSVVAHAEPAILLVDEVLAVGDVAFQIRSFDRMKEFRRSGCTIIFVSHRMTAVTTMCDQAIWLDRGVVKDKGSAQEVAKHYLDAIDGVVRYSLPDLSNEPDPDIEVTSITLTKVELLGKNNRSQANFDFNEKLTVRLYYKAKRNVKTPRFIVAIETRDAALFVANMALDGKGPDSIQQGEGIVDCVFSGVPLKTGIYYVAVQIRRDIMTNYFERRYVAQFQITSPPSAYGFTSELADVAIQGTAPIFVPYEWKLSGEGHNPATAA